MIKLLLALFLFQQPAYHLSVEKDSIKIYSATASTPQLKPIKVECTFNTTTAQLTSVLLDIKNYPNWVYHTKSASIIKQASPSDLYYYSEVALPWPAENRDFVSHVTVNHNAETGVVTIDAPNVEDMVAKKAHVYRTTASRGKWIITPDGDNKVKVTYYLLIDTGGSAPSWLVDLFINEGPLQTFKKLRLQLQQK